MEDILNLVDLFQRTKFKSSGVMALILEKGSHMERLYEALLSGQIQTDADAKKVFPEYAANPDRLHTLKSKLKDRLLDAILLLDLKEAAYNDRQSAFIECSKKWVAALTLISKNKKEAAATLSEHLLRIAQKHEFTEITLDILRSLRLYHGVLLGDEKKTESLTQEIEHQKTIWEKECDAESLYVQLVARYVRAKSDKHIVHEKAVEYFSIVEPHLNDQATYKLSLFGRLIESVIYDSVGDYEKLARMCQDAIRFFESKPYYSVTAAQVFHYNLFISYLNLKQYDKCIQLAENNETLFEKGSYNWFKLQELYIITSLHTKKYEMAFNTYKAAAAHHLFEQLPEPLLELWRIFEAYFYFLGSIDLLPASEFQEEFKLRRFLSQVPILSQDKAGMNISLLLLQIMFELVQGKWDKCSTKIDNLCRYRSRYLNEASAQRSRVFIKMLEQIPKASYRAPEVQKRAAKYLEELGKTPLEAANQNYEIEIIPYETLWQMLLGVLDRYNTKPHPTLADSVPGRVTPGYQPSQASLPS